MQSTKQTGGLAGRKRGKAGPSQRRPPAPGGGAGSAGPSSSGRKRKRESAEADEVAEQSRRLVIKATLRGNLALRDSHPHLASSIDEHINSLVEAASQRWVFGTRAFAMWALSHFRGVDDGHLYNVHLPHGYLSTELRNVVRAFLLGPPSANAAADPESVGGRVLAFYHSHPGLGRRILSSTYIHGSQAPDRMVGDKQVYTALVDKSVRGLLWLPTQARAQNVAQQPAAHQQEHQEQGQEQQQQLHMGRRVNGEARFVKRDGNACLNIRDIATLPPDQIPEVFSRTAHAPRKLPHLKRGVIIPR